LGGKYLIFIADWIGDEKMKLVLLNALHWTQSGYILIKKFSKTASKPGNPRPRKISRSNTKKQSWLNAQPCFL